MEKLIHRKNILMKALVSLNEVIQRSKTIKDPIDTKIFRDSEIQRFEYCVDTFWKFLKEFLEVNYGIAISSPKGVIRECVLNNRISDKQLDLLFSMIEDRNMTSHTYNEELAEEISGRIKEYYLLMKKIIDTL